MHERTKTDVLVGGRFRLVDSLAVDGFGESFRAVDESDGGSVRVRAIDPSHCVALGAPSEVLALARGPSAVRHPNLAALLDVVVEHDRWYLVHEWCDGISLAEHVAADGPIDDVTAANVVSEAAHALAAIHRVGAVHGRVDPSRIVLTGSVVKVSEFGLGMLLGDESEDWRTTLRDVEDPAVAFLSPEQARGDGAPRAESDVWALAAVFHYAITGATPYGVKTRAAQASSAQKKISAADGLDPRVAALIERALSSEPDLRPELNELVDGLRPRRAVRWPRVALVTALAGLAFAAIEFPQPTAPRDARAAPSSVTTAAPPSSPSSSEPSVEKMSVPRASAAPAPMPSPSARPRGPVVWKPTPRDPFYGVTSAGF